MMMRSWMGVLPQALMPCFPCTSWFEKSSWCGFGTGTWTEDENKRFEDALAEIDIDTPGCWESLAACIPGKTATDVKSHYLVLLEDVSEIEAGRFPSPGYNSSSTFSPHCDINYGSESLKQPYCISGKRSAGRTPDQERKKGVPWTEDEHRRFLLGLQKCGKGDWKDISRTFVITRTPTQVASHAQKYFIRLNSGVKDKRRSSIHDITTVNLPDDRPPSPSQSSSLTTQSSAPSPPIFSRSYSSILDLSQPNEAPRVLGSSTEADYQFMQPHYANQNGTFLDPMDHSPDMLPQMLPTMSWYPGI